jgi:hypothetical protein
MKKMSSLGVAIIALSLIICGCSAPGGSAPGGSNTSLPNAPDSLNVVLIDATSVLLTWTDSSSNENGFKIRRTSINSGTQATIDVASPNSTSYTDVGLTATGYRYSVRAYNSLGESAESSLFEIWVGDPINAPTNLSAGVYDSHSIDLSWTQNSPNCHHFTIQRSASSNPDGFAEIATSNLPSYRDTSCNANTAYWYRVEQTSNQNVISEYSNLATATTTAAVQPPSNLIVSAGASSISLNWTGSATPGASYAIMRRQNGFSTASQIASGITAISYTDSTASTGIIFFYSVKAVVGSDSSATSERSGGILYVYNEVESNGPSSWGSTDWYSFGNILTGKDLLEVKGGYSGSYAIYNPNQDKNYDYDIYKISMARGNSIAFTRNSGNVDLLSGMVVALCWVDSSGGEGSHNLAAAGETYSPWVNAGLTITKAYIQVSIPTGITGSSYDFTFAITR